MSLEGGGVVWRCYATLKDDPLKCHVKGSSHTPTLCQTAKSACYTAEDLHRTEQHRFMSLTKKSTHVHFDEQPKVSAGPLLLPPTTTTSVDDDLRKPCRLRSTLMGASAAKEGRHANSESTSWQTPWPSWHEVSLGRNWYNPLRLGKSTEVLFADNGVCASSHH